ncbi:MAG: asparagine synthase (glutamine-hydrolyzing) [Rhizobiales bacterium NRL2]|jgi:asparagine synthase (glutamine-hydrolysing)|nr:MAG: asparagine synthase (glutamine-hydrolyzing) [Rhizobiales bacterium NRL2]
MCGIYGYFDRGARPMTDAALKAMSDSLVYRGPDDSGVARFDHGAVGNRRLSIIDIAGGHQPMTAAEGKVALVQNGEIYNYVELGAELRQSGWRPRTHSDTEVLLGLYLRDGPGFVRRLNGMFAIAVYDARGPEPVLHLWRDRVGVKPLFVYENGERLLFGSEIKALLAGGAPAEADKAALHHFLTLNYVPPPLTAFRGIRHLPPGGHMKITPRGAETDAWWRLADCGHQPWRGQEAGAQAELLALLDDAVRLRLRADVPFGAFLSGGIDSSTVVGLMSMHLERPVETFAIGFDDPRFDESAHAEAAARRFGAAHHLDIVSPRMLDRWPRALHHLDQPHGDVSFLPTLRVAELAARQVKMVLTGDGGDELFAGYDKYVHAFADMPGDMDEAAFRRRYFDRALAMFPEGEARRGLYHPDFAAETDGCSTFGLIEEHFEAAAHMDRVNQALYLDTALLLPGNNLVKPDRMAMAVSLEARTPFLDYRVVEHAFRLPGAMKLRNGETKVVLKNTVRPLIGAALTDRRKQMFTVPVGEWFRTELAAYAREMLRGERFHDRRLFDRDGVELMLENHIQGSQNNTREIRALLALEHWHRIFIDGETPP